MLLLCTQYLLDLLVLVEVGHYDHTLMASSLPNYQSFYQQGENRNGGVLILCRRGLVVSRCSCTVPNVCIIDLQLEEQAHIIGSYAQDSKSWDWSNLNPYILSHCVVLGDYNIDLEGDKVKGGKLLMWADWLTRISPIRLSPTGHSPIL